MCFVSWLCPLVMWLFIWGFSAGVVTKPDLVDKGAEQELIEVVTNARYHLRRGYTMVKCRGQQAITKKQTLREALDNEEDFFQNHPQLRFPKLISCNYQHLSVINIIICNIFFTSAVWQHLPQTFGCFVVSCNRNPFQEALDKERWFFENHPRLRFPKLLCCSDY